MAGWTSSLRFVNINTILVFIVYSLNFTLVIAALFVIYITLSEQRQKDIIDIADINFEFLVFFSKALLIIAIIVALVSLLGCVGVAIDNDYMLIAYIIIIGILMAAQIFVSTIITNRLVTSQKDVGEKIVKIIGDDKRENSKKFDGFQTKYQCCGIDGFNDWLDTNKGGIGYIPGTCCNKKPNETCAQDTMFGVKGCKKIIIEIIGSLLQSAIYVIFFIFFVEVLLAVCSILVIMDIGQPSEDNTSDEIVVVASLKKKLSPNRENRKFEESIDTHDSHHAQPESIQSPVAKMDEIDGLYDEEKIIQTTQDDELEDEESHEDDIDTVEKGNKITSKENEDDTHDDEEIIIGDLSKDEVSDEENSEDEPHDDESEKVEESQNPQVQTKKAADEEIYLEGNLETKDHQKETTTEKQANKKKKGKTKYIKKRNTSVKKKAESTPQRVKTVPIKQEEKDEEEEEAEEEEEDERLATVNQTKLEENIHVSKSKRFGKKKYGEKKVQKERIRDRRRFK